MQFSIHETETIMFYLHCVLPGHTWAWACARTKLGNIGDCGGQQAIAVRMESDQQKAVCVCVCVCVCVGWGLDGRSNISYKSSEEVQNKILIW
jgi:hypothetical protein